MCRIISLHIMLNDGADDDVFIPSYACLRRYLVLGDWKWARQLTKLVDFCKHPQTRWIYDNFCGFLWILVVCHNNVNDKLTAAIEVAWWPQSSWNLLRFLSMQCLHYVYLFLNKLITSIHLRSFFRRHACLQPPLLFLMLLSFYNVYSIVCWIAQ